MSKFITAITTKTFESQVDSWLNSLKVGEAASVLFFPKTDRLRRVNQMREDKVLLKKCLGDQEHLFLALDFDLFPVEDTQDLQDFVTNQLNYSSVNKRFEAFEQWMRYLEASDITLVLLIVNGEKPIIQQQEQILFFLTALVRKYSCLKMLLCFERDIAHPSLRKLMSSETLLHQNVLYYPLYGKSDALHFVAFLEMKMEVKLPKGLAEKIYQQCGGHFWLIKEAVREYRKAGGAKGIFSGEGMLFRLEQIFADLNGTEQAVLRKLVLGQKPQGRVEEHSFEYLKKMGLVGGKAKVTIPLLSDYVHTRQVDEPRFELKNGGLLLNNIPVRSMFSAKEYRVLRGLMQQHGQLVTREELAEMIWPDDADEQYSDWAIDQLIARLRRKMTKISISPKLLKTVRGRGYVLEG